MREHLRFGDGHRHLAALARRQRGAAAPAPRPVRAAAWSASTCGGRTSSAELAEAVLHVRIVGRPRPTPDANQARVGRAGSSRAASNAPSAMPRYRLVMISCATCERKRRLRRGRAGRRGCSTRSSGSVHARRSGRCRCRSGAGRTRPSRPARRCRRCCVGSTAISAAAGQRVPGRNGQPVGADRAGREALDAVQHVAAVAVGVATRRLSSGFSALPQNRRSRRSSRVSRRRCWRGVAVQLRCRPPAGGGSRTGGRGRCRRARRCARLADRAPAGAVAAVFARARTAPAGRNRGSSSRSVAAWPPARSRSTAVAARRARQRRWRWPIGSSGMRMMGGV